MGCLGSSTERAVNGQPVVQQPLALGHGHTLHLGHVLEVKECNPHLASHIDISVALCPSLPFLDFAAVKLGKSCHACRSAS